MKKRVRHFSEFIKQFLECECDPNLENMYAKIMGMYKKISKSKK